VPRPSGNRGFVEENLALRPPLRAPDALVCHQKPQFSSPFFRNQTEVVKKSSRDARIPVWDAHIFAWDLRNLSRDAQIPSKVTQIPAWDLRIPAWVAQIPIRVVHNWGRDARAQARDERDPTSVTCYRGRVGRNRSPIVSVIRFHPRRDEHDSRGRRKHEIACPRLLSATLSGSKAKVPEYRIKPPETIGAGITPGKFKCRH